MVRCEHSGRGNREGAMFCDRCGKGLKPIEQHLTPTPRELVGVRSVPREPDAHRIKQVSFLFTTWTVDHDDPDRFLVRTNQFLARERTVISRPLFMLSSVLLLVFTVLFLFALSGAGLGAMMTFLVVFSPFYMFVVWALVPGRSTYPIGKELDDL
jgi:hypothetical protein